MVGVPRRRTPWLAQTGPASPPKMGRFVRMRRAIRTATLFTSGETSLSVILAIATIIEGAVACSILLLVLQHRSSSAVAARLGVTTTEWLALGGIALFNLACTVVLNGALSFRLITFLRGEPLGALRCWGQALGASLSLLRISLGRWTAALLIRPLRRDRTAGGLSILFGRKFGARQAIHAAFALPLFIAEEAKGSSRRRRSEALMGLVGQRRVVLDTPSSLATILATLFLAIGTALAWNVSLFLGLVVGLLGLIVVSNFLSLLSAVCSIALYIYLTNDAPTLGFQADDLKAMVVAPARSTRKRRR